MKFLKKLQTEYHKFQFLLITFFLVLLPFNAIIQTTSAQWLELNIFAYLKEVLLITILIINLIVISDFRLNLPNFIKNFRNTISENKNLVFFVLSYLTLIVVSLLWTTSFSINSFVYGFKFDGILFVAFMTGILLPEKTINYFSRFVQNYYYSLILAFILGMLLYIINPEILVNFGYRNDWSTFYANEALAYCQKIENSEICRFQGTFSGPNQAGANALVAFALTFFLLNKQLLKNKIAAANFIFIVVVIVLTFSRSAWLALIFGVLLFLCLKLDVSSKKMIKRILFSIFLVLSSVLLFFPESVLRYESNSERVELMRVGFSEFLQDPLIGKGIGVAGPASHYRENLLITENWFIQVAINYGIIGLLMFLIIYFVIAKKLYQKGELYFFVLFVSLIIPLNLLHYFEDSSFTYALFLILGAVLNSNHVRLKKL